MVVAGKASDLNSLISSDKVAPLTREQIPRRRTGINNVEYEWKQKILSSPLIDSFGQADIALAVE